MEVKNKFFFLKDFLVKKPNKFKVLPILDELDYKKNIIIQLNNTILNKKYKLTDYYLNNDDYQEAINSLNYPKYIFHPNTNIIMENPYLNKINNLSYEKTLIDSKKLNNYIPNYNLKNIIGDIRKEKYLELIEINKKIVIDLYDSLMILILRISNYLGKSNLLKFNHTIQKFNNYLKNKDKILNISEITDIIEGFISIWFNLPFKYKKEDNSNAKYNLIVLSQLKISIINYFNFLWNNNINGDLSWNSHDPPLFYNYFLNLIKRLDYS